MKIVAPWTWFYSNSCCLCCHVHTDTMLLGMWYLIINAVFLVILLSTLVDLNQYSFSSAELRGNSEFMDDANMYIAIVISLLMILICAMATYGAYKQHAEYVRQLPPHFPYRDDIISVNPACLVLIILLFLSIILTFKGSLTSCVWNCYQYINGRNSSDVPVYVTSDDTTVLLPPYEDGTAVSCTTKEPPPPYMSA
uniref:Lysosomal-associated transmembrane protein 4B n=1 Tax=Jaculus jaculus TaxID=51337 RepID=A0A8C5K6Q9_JACJA